MRVQAVIDARREGLDIVLVARCDARVISFDECLERCVAFATMGAEIIFAEAILTVDELRMFAEEMRRRAPSAILMVNVLEGGKTPMLPADEYARMGYTIVAYPLSMLMATISACKSMLLSRALGAVEFAEFQCATRPSHPRRRSRSLRSARPSVRQGCTSRN